MLHSAHLVPTEPGAVDLFLSNFGYFPGTSDAIAIRVIVLSRDRHSHQFSKQKKGAAFLIIEENRAQLSGGAERGGVLLSSSRV